MNGQQTYINMEVRRHIQQIQSWATRVQSARSHVDAFRIATQAPGAGGVLNSIKSLWQRDQNLARRQVERNLEQRLDQMTPEEISQHAHVLRRCMQGHYPLIYRRIEALSRADS